MSVPFDIPDYGLQRVHRKKLSNKCILDNNSNEGLNDLYIVEDKLQKFVNYDINQLY